MLVDEQMVPENSVQQIQLLASTNDGYGGVRVEIKNPMDSNVFGDLLRASISQWRQKGTKGVWIKLPIEHANLIEAAVKEGFRYHHAEPDYLMLVYWIPKTAHTLPANASHRVGIGAFVINSKREVLVVQENSGSFKGTGVWKLPTGVVNEGEDICTAAIREVEEETGWMPVEEYAAQPFVKKNPQFDSVANICLAKIDVKYTGLSPFSAASSSGKPNILYFNNQDLKQPLSSGNQA
ncbi:hypothetical protein PVL29_015766 [Vitis rotundifolia]|uniref:Nudix hydrolase domain-containing protein n=1 Tax=Vitis rotundifolia TaxID=103349 RepID=A0AA39DJD7_VITRO|nr:hypothetical protein PVL29_015766 [Vitis rotundifolia]